MSDIIDIETSECFEVDEFFDFVAGNIKPGDDASLVENAWALRALANNRTFVLDAYHRELESLITGKSINEHLPQSVHIKSSGDFYVRANIWLPVGKNARTAEFEKRLYAFDLPHDHNFSFVTVGYFGPGYETDIYTYDYASQKGHIGEPVNCEFQGRYILSPGRMIHFRSGRDIHIQYVPSEISVSLNLMCRSREAASQQQYIFDLDKRTLAGGAGDLVSNRLFIIEKAGLIGNEETEEILADYVKFFPCEKTKAAALRSLEALNPKTAMLVHAQTSAEVRELASRPLITGNYACALTGG